MSTDPMPIAAEVDTGGLLKLMGEPLRWEIVCRLAVEDLCTCHLVDDLHAAQSLISSHHLKVLRRAGVVRSEKVGTFTYYMLERPVVARLADALGELAAAPPERRRRPCW